MTPRTEQELLDCTIDLATACQWRVFHPRPARLADGQWRTATQGHKGWPDLALARGGVLLLRELKGPDARGRMGHLSADQQAWAQQLAPGWYAHTPDPGRGSRATWVFDVWTPDDWHSLIVPTLTGRRQEDVA